MKTAAKLIVCLIATMSCSQVQPQIINEIKIYNSLIDSLYGLQTCFKIINPPFYRCCDVDTLSGKDYIKCCESSSVPKKYRVYCSICVNKQQFDTLNVLMIVSDSLLSLDIRKDKKFLLSRIDKNSAYYDFIKTIKHSIASRKLTADSLRQQNIKFIAAADFDESGFTRDFGKREKQIFLGYLNFSRIYIDPNKGLGLFKVDWLGGSMCGYNRYFLIHRVDDVWKIYKIIWVGVY
jgi:hypothetical protein